MHKTSVLSGMLSRIKLEWRWYANTPLCQTEAQIAKKNKKFVGHLTFTQSREDQLKRLEMSTKSLSQEKSEAETVDLISVLEGGSHLIQKACSVVIQRSQRGFCGEIWPWALMLDWIRVLGWYRVKNRTYVENNDHMITCYCFRKYPVSLPFNHKGGSCRQENPSKSPFWCTLNSVDGSTGELPVVTGAFVVG